MKSLTTILLLAIVFGACTDSNDDSSESNLIEGIWTIEKLIDNGTVQTLDQCELMETLSFTSNTAINRIYTGQQCEIEDEFEVNYTIDGDKLRTISDITGIQEMTISTLNSNQLILKRMEYGLMDMEFHYKR